MVACYVNFYFFPPYSKNRIAEATSFLLLTEKTTQSSKLALIYCEQHQFLTRTNKSQMTLITQRAKVRGYKEQPL